MKGLKIILIIVAVGLVLYGAFLLIYYLSTRTANVNITTMEYRQDIDPINNRFPKLDGVKKCYWKAANIGNTRFGPSSYWMKGFLILSDDKVKEIFETYDWEQVDLTFINGINPEVTGFPDFSWSYNKKFSDEIRGASFIGEFYLDTLNGVIYFDLESN